MFDTKKLALFLGGVVFGSAGFKVLSSKDAKKIYTQTTAAVLRMKDCTMQTVNKVQEEAGDILADAKVSIFGFFNLTTFRRQFAYANHTTQAKLPDCMILTAIVFPSRF